MRSALALPFLLAGLTGCGQHSSYVKSDDSALGRVVVYRNGIAYYERRAMAENDQIRLAVPQDKVDDFLKSLTVADAETGAPVPVSYPTAGASQGNVVDMTIQLPPGTNPELIITYITDSPAWKPSYRLMVGADDTVKVQGWAIVDNTSGEDWTKVKVGVGASSALSFRYDLRSVVHVHRETLGGKQAFVAAPPTGGATHGTKKAEEQVLLALGDEDIPAEAGHPSVVREELARVVQATPAFFDGSDNNVGDGIALDTAKSKVSKRRTARAAETRAKSKKPAVQDARLQGLANRLRSSKDAVSINGFVRPGGTDRTALDQANRVRNRLIQLGVAPGRVQVKNKGQVAGKAGVELELVKQDEAIDGDGQPVGESHFESTAAMSVPKGTSAMVAVLDSNTQGEVVYVYSPGGDRGNDRFAFKAVRFQNPTESTLESGPVTVYGTSRFIGEGLTDSIPPKSTALIPFALDRQVKVDRTEKTDDRIARMLTVQRGVFSAEVRHTRTTTMEVTNRSHKPATVFLRHALPSGWNLGKAPKVYEEQGEDRLFVVDVPAGESTTVSVEAWTPLTRTVDLRSPVGVDLMQAWLDTRPDDSDFVKAVQQIMSVHTEMAEHHTRIQGLRSRMGEYRNRKQELTAHVERLEETRLGDALRRGFVKKLKDLENRLQKSTLEVVHHQEQLMLTRIRFQDAVAELTLEKPTKVAAR